ncbi:FAD-binding oxidoreductase [bacterium]|nr:MAG: FAD-binding oxidoreductase [bacterium]
MATGNKPLAPSDYSSVSLRERFSHPTVNDVHSALNPTRVARIVRPGSTEEVAAWVGKGERLSVAGGRHSMGGQAFASDALMLDMRSLEGVVSLDQERGIARVKAGTQWPELAHGLASLQDNDPFRWTFRQKQTGGDRLTLGGALASNIHSRGLAMRPIVDDVESLERVSPSGEIERISRTQNSEHWPLAIGSYGMFGVITEVDLRLSRRHKIRRRVVERESEGLDEAFVERIAQGFEYGDFQFAIDSTSEDFLRKGIFACYEPVPDETLEAKHHVRIPKFAWHHLVRLAHDEKAEAYRLYSDFYRKSDGQIYWSDDHQMTLYLDGYHRHYDHKQGARVPGSEMITELYVPRARLESFLTGCRRELRRLKASVIYGTVRIIEPDEETFLPWATQPWACIIFNLHVDHDAAGIERAQAQFRALIDLAQDEGGTFYLTYHRWATREQLLRSYPQLPEFLARKREADPDGVLTSDWYRHLTAFFE